jgi:CubicO group peptidase (beta-lactamase class C family)
MIIRQPKWTRRAILTSGVLGLGLARLSAAPVKTLTQTKANAVRTKLDAIGRAVEVETRAGRATAISISVAVKGDIFWERGFGVAYRGTARPATAHTPFSLASITKTFTAAAVMRLVESGRLDLDAPIDRYLLTPLPRSRFQSQAITLRLLGGHAAGLPSLFQMFEPPRAPPTTADLISDYGELAYPAGERYEYANLGYSLLGAAISHATGQEFSKSLHDLIIRPMGLHNTFFDTDSARMRAAAGRYDPNDREIPFYTTATPPSGELYSSAHDLSILAANMMGLKYAGRPLILGQEALDALFSPVFTSHTKAFTTFGWSGRDVAGERIIVKTGGQPGVAARLTLLPSRKISIAVIANRDDNRKLVANISSEIAASLMSDWSSPDFQMEEAAPSDVAAQDYDGSWSGSIRTGGRSQHLRILINAGGASTCIVGNGSAQPIRDMTAHSHMLKFSVDGSLAAITLTDGAVLQLDFKLIVRDDDLVGRCLSVCDRPGFTLTEPHIVTLSKS